MEFRYTKHQVARGARPDAIINGNLVLAKFPSMLRATYQIRLLLFMAVKQKVKLVVRVRRETKLSPAMSRLAKEHPKNFKLERVG
jgi:hypothetical protein